MIEKYKSILITQSQLKNYSGSEVVTLELVEYFIKLNKKVTILTHHTGPPIKEEFEKLGVNIVLSNSEEAKNIDASNFDLIWVHHYTLTPELIDTITKSDTKVVFNHMSYVEPFETILFPLEENTLADTVLFNSPETENYAQNVVNNILGHKLDNAMVFANPVPDSFFGHTPKSREELKHIAIVSNHPPDEIIEAVEIIRKKGIKVDFIGRTVENKILRVDAQVLSKYDAIISIGKTVQYCFALEMPIYCYDRFGGPGYITTQNYEKAQYYNFSGRGFEKKLPEQISNDILAGYPDVIKVSKQIKLEYAEDYRLSKKMTEVFSKLESRKITNKAICDQHNLMKYAELLIRIVPGFTQQIHVSRYLEKRYQKRILDFEQRIHEQTDKIHQQKDTVKKLELAVKNNNYKIRNLKAHTNDIMGSRTYKIGSAIIYIPKKSKKFVKRFRDILAGK